MLGIEPLELNFNKEMSWSVKLTNKTKACFAFHIKSPSKLYTIEPDKGIVPPESHEYLVQITLPPQERAPEVTQNADMFVVHSTLVSNGLGVDDINEDIFHKKPGKVVDEVNLMVVYEPKKTLKNSRRRRDADMSAEEVPELKKRKIIESSFGKGKSKLGSSENAEATFMDISSSVRGQCTMQTEQCHLHTVQSFSRHYRTSMRYLGGESHRVVDVSRGAMGSLLDKLGKLVTGDYSLDLRIKKDIESFSEDLRNMHRDLLKLENVNDWVEEVRELSYHIEDMVDCFLMHVEPDSSSCGFKEITRKGLNLLVNGMPTHHQIDDVIRDIKEKVKDVADRKEKYNIDVNNVVANVATKSAIDDLRNLVIFEHKEMLVGIETPMGDLIKLFEEGGDVSKQDLKIISIIGMGGLGKTTLAYALYDKLQEQYETRAFVPVGRNPDVKTVLKNITSQIEKDVACKQKKKNANEENLDVHQIVKKLEELLKNKRYIIVIDDLWDYEAWRFIQCAFPRNNRGGRVITTRIESVVARDVNNKVYRIKPLSEEESRGLFFRRIFGSKESCPDKLKDMSVNILKRCGGMPLAINSIASLLACEEDTTWEHVRKSLGALTEGNTDLDNMKQILDLSYIHLPDHLKTCLLYVCMYPEDQEIDKNELLRQWVDEGFVHVSTNSRLDAEDVAEKYFTALINMCMIQPGKIDYYNNEVLSCRVHDIILDLMRSKSTEVNFLHVTNGLKYVTGARGEIRRVSVQCNDEEDSGILKTIKGSLSHARSVLLYQRLLLPDFLKFKYVRVLRLEDEKFSQEPLDLTCISSLFLLRYLKIACCMLSFGELKLPDQIGQLQQLETIDLQGGELTNYPSDIVTLPWLLHLRYSGHWGRMLPFGIERLKFLRTLEGVCVAKSSVETIKGLGELTNLRNLGIDSFFNGESEEMVSAHMNAFYSSISRLSTSLRILTLKGHFKWGVPVPEWTVDQIKEQDPYLGHIRKLHLSAWRSFGRCLEWIGQLHYLYSLTIKVKEVSDGISIVAVLTLLE